MKKLLPVLLLFVFAVAARAQVCVRDSSIFGTNQIVAPPAASQNMPTTTPACVGEPYALNVTFNIPDSISISGFTAPLDSIVIAMTGAITNLPSGLTYACDPPNCHFRANTLDCILISGTTNAAPGLYDLKIKLTAYSPLVPIPLTLNFPQDISDTLHYYIEVRPTGSCTSSANDLSSQLGSLKNVPNPFSDVTEIQVSAFTHGDFRFEVFDLLGHRMYEQPIQLVEGKNQFRFDASDLPNGSYFFSIGNAEGRAVRQMVIAR